MKAQVRVLGIDDGPFTFSAAGTPVVGVVMRLPNYVEGVMCSEVSIDGLEATDVVVNMVKKSKYREQVRLIIVDGIALGGFNVLDLDEIYLKTEIPVCSITRDKPSISAIERALRKHFSDWEQRLKLITKNTLEPIRGAHKPIYVCVKGMSMGELKLLLRRATVRGALPEALRVAHLIAAAMVKGESEGKA